MIHLLWHIINNKVILLLSLIDALVYIYFACNVHFYFLKFECILYWCHQLWSQHFSITSRCQINIIIFYTEGLVPEDKYY